MVVQVQIPCGIENIRDIYALSLDPCNCGPVFEQRQGTGLLRWGGDFRRFYGVPAAANNNFHIAFTPVQDLFQKHPSADVGRNQLDAAFGELVLHFTRNHAALQPGTPVHRHDSPRPFLVKLKRELIEYLVGSGVIGLASIAKSSGYRREEHEELQRLSANKPGEYEGAVGLGANHAIKRIRGFVLHQLIFDYAGTMDDPIQAAIGFVNIVYNPAHGGLIADIGLVIANCRTMVLQGGNGSSNLSVTLNLGEGCLHLGWRRALPLALHLLDQSQP